VRRRQGKVELWKEMRSSRGTEKEGRLEYEREGWRKWGRRSKTAKNTMKLMGKSSVFVFSFVKGTLPTC
jgi:hypothetical protein